MVEKPSTTRRLDEYREILRVRGQDHVLAWWDQLTEGQRELLLGDLDSIQWGVIDPLIKTHILKAPSPKTVAHLEPPTMYPSVPDREQEELYQTAVRRGRELLSAGKVAAFTVAGGQGSRLGHDGPKGTISVTPAGDRTLFEIFGHSVSAARQKYGADIPWYVMTSPENHDATLSFFRSHDFFSLPESDVMLFPQGMLPAFDLNGRLLLAQRHRLAMAPDGHGGSLKALASSGALDDMTRRGVEIVSYFQVDNPLVKPFDALFVGLLNTTGAEMGIKVAAKADDLERVGNVCMSDGRLTVVEYTEFPESLAHARNPDGSRRFDAGNLAIHLATVDFLQRIVGSSFSLPFRRAEKKVPCVDDKGNPVTPNHPNAIKLETFVFDALTLAKNPLVMQVDREEEFSPVKNATGVDSLESAKTHQVRRACRWLEEAGVTVPRNAGGSPNVTVAISPRFAIDSEDVHTKRDQVPHLVRGDTLYIE